MQTLTIEIGDELNSFIHEDAARLGLRVSQYIGALTQICMKEARGEQPQPRTQGHSRSRQGMRQQLLENCSHASVTAWLRCHITRGMFSDEVAATYPATGEPQKSVFVPKSRVRTGEGELGEVNVLFRQLEDGTYHALLPADHGGEVVKVENGDLRFE